MMVRTHWRTPVYYISPVPLAPGSAPPCRACPVRLYISSLLSVIMDMRRLAEAPVRVPDAPLAMGRPPPRCTS